jgi:alpha-tubulin suppressor-like RCC1 family protein
MSHSLFLKNDGTVWATGGNYYGQIGNQPLYGVTSPVQILGLSGIIEVSAGGNHSLFLKNDATVWGVGSNAYGQLGNVNVGSYNYSPFQITGLSGITKLSGGYLHSLFLKSNGTVWSSGMNTYGQLGDGITINNSIPFAIPGLTGAIAIDAGVHNSFFLKDDTTIRSAGNNNSGQLSDGTTIERHTPVLVNNVCSVSLGIQENYFDNYVSVYPNPCYEQLFINFTNIYSDYTNTTAEIFSLEGLLLQTIALKTRNTKIQVDHLTTGIYLVHIKSPKGVIVEKIIKN